MRKIQMIVFLLSMLLFPVWTHAFQNQPDNFRGIKPGTHIRDCPDMILGLRESAEKVIYTRTGENKKLGFDERTQVDINSVQYKFYKDRFFDCSIFYSGEDNHSVLKALFTRHFGGPNRILDKFTPEYWIWYSKELMIMIAYNEDSQKGSISYIYNPILLKSKKWD